MKDENNGPVIAPVKHDRDNGVRPRKRLRALADLDGRTRAAVQARTLVGSLQADIGGNLSAAEKELIQRAALVGAMAQDLEVAWLERRPADLTVYGQLCDRQRRLLSTLGSLRRPPKDITPSSPPAEEYWKGLVKRAKVKSK
jgi:hypothetical protein